MMKFREYKLGKIQLIYMTEEMSGHTSMLLLPEGKNHAMNRHREWLDKKQTASAWDVGSLCYLSLRHHYQGNGAGGTLKYGESVEQLKFENQNVEETENDIYITTKMTAEGYAVFHVVHYTKGEKGIEINTIFENKSDRLMTLDMLSSFSMDNLSPMQEEDSAYSLYLHRFHGGWSLEGKHQEDSVERLNLGGTWIRAFPESERYGCVGSFPVRRWFPFGCVEDRNSGVFWAAQLAINSSWQIEFSKDGDSYSLSGGLGDSETAGWWKNVLPGEKFYSPKAYLSVGEDLETVCQNITGMFQKFADAQPKREHELPIIFNEWCTSWGNPTEQSILKAKDSLKGLPISTMVLDAGWSTQPKGAEPQGGNGDWICDENQFPKGLKSLSAELEKAHLELGIWLEFEVTTEGAKVHEKEWDHMHLKRNGELIQTGKIRRFWDFRKSETIEYLKKVVIELLKENNIQYLKVDYNGSIGAGCDGAESPGEGLRQQMQAVYQFFKLIRQEIPELVIENCASGGHRLEPCMMSIAAVSAFSDAHECQEIPYIAANLHHLILPRQCLILSVLSQELTVNEFYYRIVSTFLGRMCLSGDVVGLDEKKAQILKEGCHFYEQCRDIIKLGFSRVYRNCTENPHHLRGYQIVCRQYEERMLVVFHAFENGIDQGIVELPAGNWKTIQQYGEGVQAVIKNQQLEIKAKQEWSAAALILEKVE